MNKYNFNKVGNFSPLSGIWHRASGIGLSKKAQNEMIGFGIILVIVIVALMIFLTSSLKNNDDDVVQNYELSGFLQAFLEYTVENCAKSYNYDYMSMRDTLMQCSKGKTCYSGNNPCDVFEKKMEELVEMSWDTGKDKNHKGFVLNVTRMGEEVYSVSLGNTTYNSKTETQEYEGGIVIFATSYE